MDDSPAQNQPGSQPLPQDNGPMQGDVTPPPPPNPPVDTQPFPSGGPSSTVQNPMPSVSSPTPQPPPLGPDMASTTAPIEPPFSPPSPIEPETSGESTAIPTSSSQPASVQPPVPTEPLSFTQSAPFVPEQSASAMPDPLPMEHPIVPSEPALEMPPSLEPAPPPVPPPPPPPPPPSGEVSLMGDSGSDFSYGAKPAWYKSKLILSVLIILLAAGLVVGGLFIIQNRGGTTDVATTEELAPQPTLPPPAGLTLTLDSPGDGEVFHAEEATLSGKTSPNTVVIFVSSVDQSSVESDTTGVFSGKVKIAQGLSEIHVVAVGSNGEEKGESRYVVYDSE